MTHVVIKRVSKRSDAENEQLHECLKQVTKPVWGCSMSKLLANLRYSTYHDKYAFSGVITDDLVDKLGHVPTPTEVLLLIECTVPEYGAYCCISGRNVLGFVFDKERN